MKSVYLESSVVSYIAARPIRGLIVLANQQVTRDWWGAWGSQYELFVSDVVVAECAAGDAAAASERGAIVAGMPMLSTTAAAENLAEVLLGSLALPRNAAVDALHIAVATVNGMDFLLKWNCTHIANASMQQDIRSTCIRSGYIPPTICTPQQLMEG